MENCIFCKIANHEIPGSVVYEDEICLAFLDLSQSTKGHTLVVCKDHYENMLECDDQVLTHMFLVAKKLANQMKTNLNAKGVNILSNAGEAAGQSVLHFHIHLIPRYDEKDGFDPVFTSHQGEYDLEEVKKQIIG